MTEPEGPNIYREGITRRELMKRSAVVGGTVLWAAPVIQSFASPAMAQPGYADCGCCYCWEGDRNNPDFDHCNDNGNSGPRSDPASCAAYCADPNQSGAAHSGSEQCAEFAAACSCRQITDPGVDPGENGCSCA